MPRPAALCFGNAPHAPPSRWNIPELPHRMTVDGATRATTSSHRRASATAALLQSLITLPLVASEVAGATHWEALRLRPVERASCRGVLPQLRSPAPCRLAKGTDVLGL